MAPYNHEAPPKIQLRLEEELNVPAMLNTNFVIKDKKEILRFVFRLIVVFFVVSLNQITKMS